MRQCPRCKKPTKNKDFVKKGEFGPRGSPEVCKKCRDKHVAECKLDFIQFDKRDRERTRQEVLKNLQENGTK